VGAEEKNRNEILSRIVADLSVKSKDGEELSSKIHRLRDEIKKVIENEDTIFGKISGLVESFREIIPEEKQRYNAALKALSATSKLSQQEIIKAVNNQLGELKILEKGLLSALPGWRDELKATEAKSREMRDEISKLRERIGRLESEEKEILNGMAAREKEMERVEKAVGEIFADIGSDITYTKKRVEEFTAESAATQPIPPRDSIFPSEKKSGEQKSIIPEPSAQKDTEFQKKCPMCGGRMDFNIQGESWICYSCAYELKKDGVPGKSEKKSEHKDAFEITPTSESIFDLAIPTLSSREYREPIKEPIQGSIQGSSQHKKPSPKKKTCPACRKKMNWYEEESAWRCPFCEYERRI